jgi:hypothetical protein
MGQQQGGGQMGGMETARNMVGQQGGPRDDQGQGMGMSQGQGQGGQGQGQSGQSQQQERGQGW